MSGFNITIKRRRLAAAADPATCEFYFYIFYNSDIGDLLTPIRRCSSRLRCCRFSMSDVYIGRTLLFMAAHVTGQAIYIFILWFLLSFFFFS